MKRGYLLTVLLLLGAIKAELDINKPAGAEDKSRELHAAHSSFLVRGVPTQLKRVNLPQRARVITKTTRVVRRGLDDGGEGEVESEPEEPAGAESEPEEPAMDESEPEEPEMAESEPEEPEMAESEPEEPEMAESEPIKANCVIHDDPEFTLSPSQDSTVMPLLTELSGEVVEAWLSTNSDSGILTCTITIEDFVIQEDFSQIADSDLEKQYLISINENGTMTSQLLYIQDNKISDTYTTTSYATFDDNAGTIDDPHSSCNATGERKRLLSGHHKVTFIRKGRKMQVEELGVTDGVVTEEPEGENLEITTTSGMMLFDTPQGEVERDVVISNGDVLIVNEPDNNEIIPPPDLSASGDIQAVILEKTDDGEVGFEAHIVDSHIIENDQVPAEIFNNDEVVTVITEQDGQHIVQTAEEDHGTFVSISEIPEVYEEVAPPAAEVLQPGVIEGEAIVETNEGLLLEPIVINNLQVVEFPEHIAVTEEPQNVDIIVHDSDQLEHVEHVVIEGTSVVNAIADENIVPGIIGAGEEQYEVITNDSEGFHISPITVDHDVIVEEPVGMDFEHGFHEAQAIVPDEHGHHVEDLQINEGTIINRSINGYMEVQNVPGVSSMNMQTSDTTQQTDKGFVHVQLLLDYDNTSTVEEALVHNGEIVEEAPGSQLSTGIKIAKEIINDADGLTMKNVVVHDGLIEDTESAPIHEDGFDLTQGDYQAIMIEGQGANAQVENVEILNGNIVNESTGHNLENGTHLVETIINDGDQTHIQRNVVVNGRVLQFGGDAVEKGIVLIKNDDVEYIMSVEIKDNTIIKHSEGLDLDEGTYAATLILISPMGNAQAPINVAIEKSVITEFTRIEPVSDENMLPSTGNAIIIIKNSEDAENGQSEIYQVRYDNSKIVEVQGGKTMCDHCSGIEVILGGDNFSALDAREVQIDDMNITVVTNDVEASSPTIDETVTTDNNSATQTSSDVPSPPSVVIDADSPPSGLSDADASVSNDIDPAGSTQGFDLEIAGGSNEQAELLKRNLYNKNYNPLNNRGLNNRTAPVLNKRIIGTANKIALSQAPVIKPIVNRVTYQQAPMRTAQFLPRVNVQPYNPLARRGRVVNRPVPSRIGLNNYNPAANRQQIGFRPTQVQPRFQQNVLRPAQIQPRFQQNVLRPAQIQPRFQQNVLRPAQIQPRFQQNVYKPAPAFHPANQIVNNVRTVGGRNTSVLFNRQPAFVNNPSTFNRVTQVESAHSEITFDDVPPMISALDKVSKRYENYYSVFPLSDSDQKLLVSSHQDVMEYYHKMRIFVRKVIEDRHELMADFNIIIQTSSQLSTGEKEMISFYGYHNTYAGINESLKEYNTDERVTTYQKDIDTVAGKFNVQIKDARSYSANLVQLENYFSDEITQINQITSDNESQASLEKYDRMLALGMKVIETKKELEVTSDNLRTSLSLISLFKTELDDDISGLKKLIESSTLTKTNALQSSALKMAVVAILTTMLLL